FAGEDIHEDWFPVSMLGTGAYAELNEYIVHTLNLAAEYCLNNIVRLPPEYRVILNYYLVYIPVVTGDWDYTVDTRGAACTEDKDTHTGQQTANALATVNDIITCLDISTAFANYTKGDFVGVKVTCDALNATTDIHILGIRLRGIKSK
ncbi:MAG: hypothetical protein U1D67_01320, partial [Dehalococcoidia bacterium]|nr:hypothetical protein [Dehalococcoidia bacterium]